VERFDILDSTAAPLPRANIDTDQILPARFLHKPRKDGYGQYLFHDLRFRQDGKPDPDFILNRPHLQDTKIVIGGENFACGSSRENAVWCFHDYGIRALLAPSFGDIFFSNSLKNGLLPIRLPGEVIEGLMNHLAKAPDARVRIDLPAQTVTLPDGSTHGFQINAFAKHCLINGIDELDYTLGMLGEIESFEQRYARSIA
jgi:3-isopropylmalate/(R)-2-methylmalate dehydratase small subunit